MKAILYLQHCTRDIFPPTRSNLFQTPDMVTNPKRFLKIVIPTFSRRDGLFLARKSTRVTWIAVILSGICSEPWVKEVLTIPNCKVFGLATKLCMRKLQPRVRQFSSRKKA